MNSIAREVQSLTPDTIVSLFELLIPGVPNPLRFTLSGTVEGRGTVPFRGEDYTPIDAEIVGFAWDGTGSQPTPTCRLPNTDGLVGNLLRTYDDLLGSRVTRYRTFRKHLDDGTEPDPDAIFPVDIYRIERKVRQTSVFVELELAASIDQEGIQLPRRQVLREICTHTYRNYNEETDEFSYTNVTCPYVGDRYFNRLGEEVVLKREDCCGKRLTDCRKRFGEGSVLPTRAFPGVARNRL